MTGAGEKSFVAGADIAAMSTMTVQEAREFSKAGNDSIVDNQVHTREADHFVQLISALIDISPFRHKGSDFTAFFLYRLWKVSTYIGHFGF